MTKPTYSPAIRRALDKQQRHQEALVRRSQFTVIENTRPPLQIPTGAERNLAELIHNDRVASARRVRAATQEV